MTDPLVLDAAVVTERLVKFIQDTLQSAGRQHIVLGLSGGIDSALVAHLCARAVGGQNVRALIMPYATSSPLSEEHARLVIKQLDLDWRIYPIAAQIDSYFDQCVTTTPLRIGNKCARERMSILYDHSADFEALVAGTSNKTERCLGYGTLHGDCACDFNPIGNLYKTQVRQLSAHLGVPQVIIDKAPSADLWPGQTDEGEMNFTYAEVDDLLVRREQGLSTKLVATPVQQRVDALARRNAHKAYGPKIAAL